MQAIIQPVWTWLTGLNYQDRLVIDRAFAIPIPGVQFQPRIRMLIKSGRWDGCMHLYDMSNNRLPTGLLPKLKNLYPDLIVVDESMKGLERAWADAKAATGTVEVNGVTLTPDQRNAAVAMVEHRRGVVLMATGAGKTEVYAAAIKALQLPAIVIIHRKDLLHQTAERLERRLGVPVGKIGDGQDSPGTLATVAMVQSIKPRQKGWQQRLSKYNVAVFDEAHHLGSDSQQAIGRALVNAPFRWAMSGSLPDEKKDRLRRLRIMAMTNATLLYEVKNKELIDTGWNASPIVHLHPVHFKNVPRLVLTDSLEDRRRLYQEQYDRLIVDNPAYHDLVAQEIDHWHKQGLAIFVLVNRIAHGLALSRRLAGLNAKHVFLTGANEGGVRLAAIRDFKEGRLPIIIATNIFDEGIDVANVQVLVLAAGGKSTVQLLQRVGRALRKKTGFAENCAHIVDIAHVIEGEPDSDDEEKDYLGNHSRRRLKIYKREDFTIQEEKAQEIIL